MADNGTARVTITEEAIKERVTEYLAQAWDEGHAYCDGECYRTNDHKNPYRDHAD